MAGLQLMCGTQVGIMCNINIYIYIYIYNMYMYICVCYTVSTCLQYA